jgi:hypothetical protein
MAKQATNNLRLISQDGKFTYYQKRSGSLFLSTNYKVTELVKGTPDTHYSVTAGDEQKKIIITQNENFHNYFSLRNPENIFVADYGTLAIHKIGQGISPQLHLGDTWISYFNPTERIITFEHTTDNALKFALRLNNRINPYFIPNVVMADENTVYYTDLGENGVPGLIEHKRNLNKSDIIYSAASPLTKFELCFNHSTLFFAETGINSALSGTKLSQLIFPFKDIKQRNIFYTSRMNDLGHMVCNFSSDSLYFIKNSGTALATLNNIVEYNFKTKKLNTLTDFNNSTSLVNMDGTLLTLDHGTYYIIKGKSDFKTIDSLKPKADDSEVEDE